MLVAQGNYMYPDGGMGEDWDGEEIEYPSVFPVGTICEVEHVDSNGRCNVVIHKDANPLSATLGATALAKGEYELVKK